MLRNTFCHLPGIGPKTEESLWSAGITSWEALLTQSGLPARYPGRRSCAEHLRESLEHYDKGNPAYFSERLAAGQRWRLFADFCSSCAYLDIETTGLQQSDHITTIALYDGRTVRTYVLGRNLNDFPRDVRDYRLLVTYNGAGFDLPFLERQFRIKLAQAHIDLRFVLKSLGFSGGLKVCERRLGVERKGLEEVDGFLAVQLWYQFQWQRDSRALETLLAYNVQDVLNLEVLMVEAYNRKVSDTPFRVSHRLPAPTVAGNPFSADPATIRRVLQGNSWRLSFPQHR